MLKRLVCLIGAVLGGTTLSQAPEYTQQYAQRLAGAVDELETVVERFDADAAAAGLTREEGLARYNASTDGFLSARGASMQAAIDRHAHLSAQLDGLRGAGPAARLVSMAQYFDTDVGRAALSDFRPAVPVTVEGLAHAAVGLVLGYILFWAGATVAAAPFRRRTQVRVEPHL